MTLSCAGSETIKMIKDKIWRKKGLLPLQLPDFVFKLMGVSVFFFDNDTFDTVTGWKPLFENSQDDQKQVCGVLEYYAMYQTA